MQWVLLSLCLFLWDKIPRQNSFLLGIKPDSEIDRAGYKPWRINPFSHKTSEPRVLFRCRAPSRRPSTPWTLSSSCPSMPSSTSSRRPRTTRASKWVSPAALHPRKQTVKRQADFHSHVFHSVAWFQLGETRTKWNLLYVRNYAPVKIKFLQSEAQISTFYFWVEVVFLTEPMCCFIVKLVFLFVQQMSVCQLLY